MVDNIKLHFSNKIITSAITIYHVDINIYQRSKMIIDQLTTKQITHVCIITCPDDDVF